MFLTGNLTSSLKKMSSDLLKEPQNIAKDLDKFVDNAEQEHPSLMCAAIGILAGLLAVFLFCIFFACIRRVCRKYNRRRRRHILTYEGYLTPAPPASKRTALRINSNRKKGDQQQGQKDAPICRRIQFDNTGDQFAQSNSTALLAPHPKNNPFEGDSAQSGDDEEIVLA